MIVFYIICARLLYDDVVVVVGACNSIGKTNEKLDHEAAAAARERVVFVPYLWWAHRATCVCRLSKLTTTTTTKEFCASNQLNRCFVSAKARNFLTQTLSFLGEKLKILSTRNSFIGFFTAFAAAAAASIARRLPLFLKL